MSKLYIKVQIIEQEAGVFSAVLAVFCLILIYSVVA
jgi:hypothetical protein